MVSPMQHEDPSSPAGKLARFGHTDIPFEAVLDAAPDAVVVVDRDGRIQLTNLQTEIMFGYRAAELHGQPIERLLAESLHAIHRQHREHYVQSPKTRPMGAGLELGAVRKDGSAFPVEISLSPLETPGGMLVTAIIRDISRRKHAEMERQHLLEDAEEARAQTERAIERIRRVQAITDRALANLNLEKLLDELLERVHALLEVDHSVFLLLDPERQMLIPQAGTGMAREAGLGTEIAVGQGFAGRVAAERAPVALVEIDDSALENPLYMQLGTRSLLGVPLVVEGRLVGVVHVGTIQRRQFQADEVELLQLVADRLALAVDNALLYQAAQQAIQSRETFLSIASHELKTPLTTVKGWVHMIVGALRGPDDYDRESMELFASELIDQVDRLDVLITDLLDASRIQQGRLELSLEQVDLAELTRRVIGRFAYTNERTDQHRLDYRGPDIVTGEWDADRLEQVLTNLISNALKYSPEGGDVLVGIDDTGDAVELSVTDQGIGIGAKEQSELFQPFTRTDSARRYASGTGLGLYITKQIVDLHGGSIDIVSDIGAGTTVCVRLPRSHRAE